VDWSKRDEIISGHEKERVLISNNQVIAYFPDERTAVAEALKKGLKQGDFLVQRCITEEEAYQHALNDAKYEYSEALQM